MADEERKILIDLEVKGEEEIAALGDSAEEAGDEVEGFQEKGEKAGKGMNSLKEGVDGATGGFLTLFKTLLTNPIGILIASLAALIGIFSKSQTGIEFFRKAGAFLNTVLGKLSDIVEELGASFIKAFEDPQQALSDFVNGIREGIVKYFTEIIPNAIKQTLNGFGLLGTAFKQLVDGDWQEAADTALEGVKQIGDGITDLNPGTFIIKRVALALKDFAIEANDAADAAFRLETAMIANEKALADIEVIAAKNRVEFVKLKTAVDDITLSTEERIAAAEKAFELENATLQEQKRLQQERVDLLKAQNDLTNSTEEDIQKVRDAEIVLAQLEEQSLMKQLELRTKLNGLIQQEATLEEQRLERARTASEELEIFQLEQADRLVEAEQRRREILLENEDLTQQERQLIIAQSEAKIGEIKKDADQEEMARVKALKDLRINSTNEAIAAGIQAFGEWTIAGKAFALAQIAFETGAAIAGAIRSAQVVPFPGNIAAAITGVASVLSGVAQAKQVLMSGQTASSISTSAINSGRGQTSAAQSTGLAGVNASLLSQFGNDSRRDSQNNNDIINGVSRLPAPQVAVTDINRVQNSVQVKESEASIG